MQCFRKIVSSLCLFMLVAVVALPQNIKDGPIGYPEVEENLNIKNKEGREPIYVPSMCPENELYYPGDQKADWICDCRPAYLYHPKTDKCWPSWRQGPCAEAEYLVLTPNTVIPSCVPNPCIKDGHVVWQGKCEKLGNKDLCAHLYPVSALEVNATTLGVSCVRLSFEMRFGEAPRMCPPGSKRSIDGVCVPS